MTLETMREQAKFNARAMSYVHAVILSILALFGLELGNRFQIAGSSFYAGFLYFMAAGLIVLAIAGVLIARSRNRYDDKEKIRKNIFDLIREEW